MCKHEVMDVRTYMHMLDFSTKVDFDGERFRYFMFLVGIQCVINAIFAKIGKRNNEVTSVLVTIYVK